METKSRFWKERLIVTELKKFLEKYPNTKGVGLSWLEALAGRGPGGELNCFENLISSRFEIVL